MSNATENIQRISVPLTARDRQAAQDFTDQHSAEERSQVYQFRLAVMATHRYLTMLGIPSDLERKKLVGPDTADLYVTEIEDWVQCRAVKADDESCYIPVDVQQNRAGYIIVELSGDERSGTIRGFVPEVVTEKLSLEALQSLDGFFERIALGPAQRDDVISTSENVLGNPIGILSHWMAGIFSGDWLMPQELPQTPVLSYRPIEASAICDSVQDEILSLYKSETNVIAPLEVEEHPVKALATLIEKTQDDWTRWQAAKLLQQVAPDHPLAATIRAKDLGLYLAGERVALLVGSVMRPDGKAIVMARVYPIGDIGLLPPELKLSGITRTDKTFFEVQSRQQDMYIQYLFTTSPGKSFTIKVSLDTASVTQAFTV